MLYTDHLVKKVHWNSPTLQPVTKAISGICLVRNIPKVLFSCAPHFYTFQLLLQNLHLYSVNPKIAPVIHKHNRIRIYRQKAAGFCKFSCEKISWLSKCSLISVASILPLYSFNGAQCFCLLLDFTFTHYPHSSHASSVWCYDEAVVLGLISTVNQHSLKYEWLSSIELWCSPLALGHMITYDKLINTGPSSHLNSLHGLITPLWHYRD